jgi:serine/threonine protein kinase
MKHLTAQPEVDALPSPFPRVIRKALEKDPKDRYQTVNEMMADVFAVEDINRSVASIDSLNLTRMAAAVANKCERD